MKILTLPAWAPMMGLTLHPNLVLLKREGRSEAAISRTLDHELVHCAQMRDEGWLVFAWLYLFSPTARLRYEAQAYCWVDKNMNEDGVYRIASHIADWYFHRWWPPDWGRVPSHVDVFDAVLNENHGEAYAATEELLELVV